MAPKTKSDSDNYQFLYECFESAVKNAGKVDIKAIAAVRQIKVGAALKRLSRLRQAQGSRGGQNEEDGEGNDDSADVTPKTAVPKAKGRKPNGKAAGDGMRKEADGTATLIPATKSKKRKLTEVEGDEDMPVDEAKAKAEV